MRQLLIFLMVFSLWAVPVLAQSDDASIYQVTDVASDVTADSAVHARDQAISEAQRTALGQLLDRLGADSSIATKLSNDDIATLVQNFEVQTERRSSVRYIGTFAIQFRPTAVRSLLSDRNISYTETRGSPVLVLPVLVSNNHAVLWEQTTKWRSAWDISAKISGPVPVILPNGGLEDIALISADEAVAGKADSIQALMEKYQIENAAVAVLNGDLDKPGTDLKFSVSRFDTDDNIAQPIAFTLTSPPDKAGLDSTLGQAVKRMRTILEKGMGQGTKTGSAATSNNATGNTASSDSYPLPAYVSGTSSEPIVRLPVSVPIDSLTQWAQMKRQIIAVPGVVGVNIITLARGSTSVEIEFHGSTDALQAALAQQNLMLIQDPANGGWILQHRSF